jgi:hypothetical protein
MYELDRFNPKIGLMYDVMFLCQRVADDMNVNILQQMYCMVKSVENMHVCDSNS